MIKNNNENKNKQDTHKYVYTHRYIKHKFFLVLENHFLSLTLS